MTGNAATPTRGRAWHALEAHYETVCKLHLRQLFADDARRGEHFACEAAGIYLDYSKNRVTEDTIRLLVNFADVCGLRERIAAMFDGEAINVTEKRAFLHVALRAPKSMLIIVAGRDGVLKAAAVLYRMTVFSRHIRSG